jgi:uncharacterized membrane protein (DUF373 family)
MGNRLGKQVKSPQGIWREDLFTRFLESTDKLIYALVGASFLIAAIVSLGYGIAKFAYTLWVISSEPASSIFDNPAAGTALITFVSDLLLSLIILEVMGTIVHYLKTRATTLKPFLFIGIISATRGVLAVGARLSVANFQTLPEAQFNASMIELGVNAGVIIALGLSLRLIGRFLDEEPELDPVQTDQETPAPSASADAEG